MPLPVEYHQCSPFDIRNRFSGSIIMYGDTPILIRKAWADTDTDDEDETYHQKFDCYFETIRCGLDGEGRVFQTTDPALSIDKLGRQMGYYNLTDHPKPFFISRIPRRGMRQGISSDTAVFGHYDDGDKYFTIGAFSMSPFLEDIDINVYYHEVSQIYRPSKETYESVRRISGTIGYGMDYLYLMCNPGFVEMFRNVYPSYQHVLDTMEKNTAVAVSRRHVIEKDAFGDVYMVMRGRRVAKFSEGRLRYSAGIEYLSGDVERSLGIQPI